MKRYQVIASAVQARKNCSAPNIAGTINQEWFERWTETIEKETRNLPSGSGIDAGVKFDFDKSTAEKLVFYFGFHHMNDIGYYDGWNDYTLTVTPSLQFGFHMKITGANRNGIKDYLCEIFQHAFAEEVSPDA